MGTAIVVRSRGGTPVRVGVFVDVCVGAEGACAVKPLETPGRTLLYLYHDLYTAGDPTHDTRRCARACSTILACNVRCATSHSFFDSRTLERTHIHGHRPTQAAPFSNPAVYRIYTRNGNNSKTCNAVCKGSTPGLRCWKSWAACQATHVALAGE